MTREEITRKLLDAFCQYGYAGLTLRQLAEACGLNKATLYHHFPQGKKEIVGAVLDCLHGNLTTEVFATLSGEGSPQEKIQRMLERVSEFYKEGQQECLLTVLALSGSDEMFTSQVQDILKHWLQALVTVFEEAGSSSEVASEQAEDLLLQIQGAIVLSRGIDKISLFERVLSRLGKIAL